MEILSQFPSPPVPNLPALAMAMAPVMPQHQQPMMTQPPVSMAMPTPAPPVMAMVPAGLAQPPTNTSFVASFPPAQVMQPCSQRSRFLDACLPTVYSHSLTRCPRRRPKRMTTTSRTSRRRQRQEPVTKPSVSSRRSRVEVSPPPLPLSTKRGEEFNTDPEWAKPIMTYTFQQSVYTKLSMSYVAEPFRCTIYITRRSSLSRLLSNCCCLYFSDGRRERVQR